VAKASHLTAHGVSAAAVQAAATRLASLGRPARAEELGARRPSILAAARLVDVGAASAEADGALRWTGALSVAEALAAARDEAEREREVERSRLAMMRRYAEHTGCRRSFLLSYFGQDYPGPCGACDNDRAGSARRPGAEPFPVGGRVASAKWGEGTVQRYDGDQVTVLFDEHGYRDLLVPDVVERALLRPARGAVR
jgi:ATP-dependent DNA helicase RecQ